MLPYWDNRCERRMNNSFIQSILFSEDFLGNGNGSVTTGFARGWDTVNDDCRSMNEKLYRTVPTDISLLYPDNATELAEVASFQDMCTPWNDSFKNMHGFIHELFGGPMGYISCAPNDPVFFFHHCLVDNFFQRFKDYALKHNFELKYPDISEANLPPGFNGTLLNFSDTQGANHVMHPFDDLINEYGLLADINKEFSYRYDVSPTISSATRTLIVVTRNISGVMIELRTNVFPKSWKVETANRHSPQRHVIVRKEHHGLTTDAANVQ